MPSAPIIARTLLWERLSDGTLHIFDWCVVTTSLGDMIEPRVLTRQTGDIRNEDLFDSSYTGISVLPAVPTGNYALDQCTVSSQWPHYRASDPGGD